MSPDLVRLRRDLLAWPYGSNHSGQRVVLDEPNHRQFRKVLVVEGDRYLIDVRRFRPIDTLLVLRDKTGELLEFERYLSVLENTQEDPASF